MKIVAMDSQILSALSGCARLYDYRFNQDLVKKGGKNNSLECGSLAHAWLEYYNKALIKGVPRAFAIEQGYNAFLEYQKPYQESNIYITDKHHVGIVNTPEENIKEGSRLIIGVKWVEQTMREYFDYYRSQSYTVLAAEEVKKFIIYQDNDIKVLWKVKYDEIDDSDIGIHPTDHKTMKMNSEYLSLNYQFMGQCIGVGSRVVIVNKIGFQTSLKPEQKFNRAYMNYSSDRLLEFQNETVPHYAHMLVAYHESGSFPPNYMNCQQKFGVCEFHNICSTDRNMREMELMLNFEKGHKWDVNNE